MDRQYKPDKAWTPPIPHGAVASFVTQDLVLHPRDGYSRGQTASLARDERIRAGGGSLRWYRSRSHVDLFPNSGRTRGDHPTVASPMAHTTVAAQGGTGSRRGSARPCQFAGTRGNVRPPLTEGRIDWGGFEADRRSGDMRRQDSDAGRVCVCTEIARPLQWEVTKIKYRDEPDLSLLQSAT